MQGFNLDHSADWSLINLRSRPWERLRVATGLALSEVGSHTGVEESDLIAIEEGERVPTSHLRAQLLRLYTPAEADIVEVETPHITFIVSYLQGKYGYTAKDLKTGNKHPVQGEWTRKQLRRALGADSTRREVEALLSKQGLQFPQKRIVADRLS